MEKANILTHKQVLDIIRMYPDFPTSEIAKKYGRSLNTIYQTAKRYKVRKSEAFNKTPESGRIQKGQHIGVETQFKKGHKSHNQGRKMPFKSKVSESRSASTRWKKGNNPQNTLYDGAIRVRRFFTKNGSVIPYLHIRIAPGKWQPLHVYLWEKAYGRTPEGHNIVFKDGDTMNCVLENLECITDAALAIRNSYFKYPSELRGLIEERNRLGKELKEIAKAGCR